MTKLSAKSNVFDLLGADSDDIEALTAYALYKRHKRRWASDFIKANGRAPSISEERAFSGMTETSDQLERYKKASDFLIAFAEEAIQSSRSEIEKEAITSRIEAASAKIGANASLWRQIGFGIVATAINTLVLLLLAIGVRLLGIDLLEVIAKFPSP